MLMICCQKCEEASSDEINERLSEVGYIPKLIIQQEKTEEVVEKINDASIIQTCQMRRSKSSKKHMSTGEPI